MDGLFQEIGGMDRGQGKGPLMVVVLRIHEDDPAAAHVQAGPGHGADILRELGEEQNHCQALPEQGGGMFARGA